MQIDFYALFALEMVTGGDNSHFSGGFYYL